GYGFRDTGYSVRDTGCGMQDVGCRIWDAGYGMRDAGYGIWDKCGREYRIWVWSRRTFAYLGSQCLVCILSLLLVYIVRRPLDQCFADLV
ncbi:hypothetical protein M422DRAFT_162225, partial [Sphaerobolus stellatus SS14]